MVKKLRVLYGKEAIPRFTATQAMGLKFCAFMSRGGRPVMPGEKKSLLRFNWQRPRSSGLFRSFIDAGERPAMHGDKNLYCDLTGNRKESFPSWHRLKYFSLTYSKYAKFLAILLCGHLAPERTTDCRARTRSGLGLILGVNSSWEMGRLRIY